MYRERYEMLKESEKTGADLSPIDFSFIDWYGKEAVKYSPQKTAHNSDYAKCPNCNNELEITGVKCLGCDYIDEHFA